MAWKKQGAAAAPIHVATPHVAVPKPSATPVANKAVAKPAAKAATPAHHVVRHRTHKVAAHKPVHHKVATPKVHKHKTVAHKEHKVHSVSKVPPGTKQVSAEISKAMKVPAIKKV